MPLIKKDDQQVRYLEDGYIGVSKILHSRDGTINGSSMLSVIEVAIAMDIVCNAPPHVCTNAEEIVYVLTGSFKFSYNGTMGELKAGDCICYPKGVLRSYENLDLLGSRLLFISPHPEPHWLRKPAQDIGVDKPKAKPLDESHVYRFRNSDWDDHLLGIKRRTFCSPKIGARSTFANRIRIGSGAEVPIHHHPQDDVSLISLGNNQIVFKYGDDSLRAGEGDALLVEAGKVHGVENKSSADAEFLEIYPTDEPEYVYTNPDGLDKSNFLRKRG